VRFSQPLVFALALAPAFSQPAGNEPTAAESKAITAVEKAGGTAELDPKLPAGARVSATFATASDTTLRGLKAAPQIGALEVIDATACTERGLAVLKDLPNLRKLTLGQSAMTPQRVAEVAKCKELRTLYLAGCGLKDADLAVLKKLTRLESLDISDNPLVTDKGMAAVATLVRLQALYLGKTGVGDKGLAELKPLDGLRALNVNGTKVTGEAADRFAEEMPNLNTVRR
jgi:hypothetical protein